MLNIVNINLSEDYNFPIVPPAPEKIFVSKQLVAFFQSSYRQRRHPGHYVQLQEPNLINEKNLLNDLRNKIRFDEGLESYLITRTDVLTLLSSVMTEIEKYFPSDFTIFFLRKSYDSNSKALVLEIQSCQNYAEAKQSLENFDDDWWLDNMPQTNDILIIGLSTL